MRRFFSFQTMLLSNNTHFPPLSLSMIFFRGHLVVSTILIPSIWRSPDKSRYTLYHFLFSLSLWHIVNTAIWCLFWYVVYFVFRIVCYDLILIWCSSIIEIFHVYLLIEFWIVITLCNSSNYFVVKKCFHNTWNNVIKMYQDEESWHNLKQRNAKMCWAPWKISAFNITKHLKTNFEQ